MAVVAPFPEIAIQINNSNAVFDANVQAYCPRCREVREGVYQHGDQGHVTCCIVCKTDFIAQERIQCPSCEQVIDRIEGRKIEEIHATVWFESLANFVVISGATMTVSGAATHLDNLGYTGFGIACAGLVLKEFVSYLSRN